VNSLAIGPNDRYILSGSSDGTLIRWDIISNESVILQKESSEIRAVALSSDGKIGLSGDSDSILTLWDISTGNQIKKFQGFGKVNSVSFSPDNNYFASAHDNSSVIIWNVLTGNVVNSFYLKNRAANSIQYSQNGDYILGGCTDGTSVMWRAQNNATVRIFRGYNNTPFALSISNDNEFLLSGVNNNAVDLWNIPEGRLIRTYNWIPNKIYLNSHITSVGFSSNKQFATVLNSNGERKSWDILTGEEKDLPINIFSLKYQNTDQLIDGRILSSWYGSIYATVINQHTSSTLQLGSHNTGITAVRFSADGKYALSGEQAGLIKIWKPSSFGSKGELKGHLDIITSISITNDNRLVGSSSEDNTVRLWDRENQEEVVKLVSSKDGEWIIATPDGYYNTSPEGSNLIHWSSVENKETYTFEQFEALFKRPDIVRARLSGNLDAGKPTPGITLPPSVEILDNPLFMETTKRTQKLFINASSTRIVKSVRFFINGKPFRTIKIDKQEKAVAIDVPLQSGSNRITVVSYDDRGFSSNPKFIDIICNDPDLSKPNLYILGIGVSKYPFLSKRWQLEFADSDAKSLIEAFEHQKGKYFSNVESNIITNENATAVNIVEALNMLRNISNNDIAVVFMAGHGVMDSNRQFYFLTSEGTFDYPKQGGIDWSTLTSHISEVKGRVIMFIDACHSGGIVTETVVPNDELAQEFFSGKRGGVMVFSASKGRQYSYESPDIGTGAGIFTYAITQGLGPKSKITDTNGNGFVEFMELVDFVTKYVKNETQGLQTPWLSRRELFGDLSVAVVSN
jgi:WD40 repeat protein